MITVVTQSWRSWAVDQAWIPRYGKMPPCWPSWEFLSTSTRRHMKDTGICLLIYAHFHLEIHKSASRPSTMTSWVSFAAGLRRIAGRRRPNLSRSRAGRPRHRQTFHPWKRPPRCVPTRTSQDGARPSAGKSARLAKSAPARNEQPRFIDGDVAALSDQDRRWQLSAGWHADASYSSGFERRERTCACTVENSEKLTRYAAYHRPFYEQLYAQRRNVTP
jgi:hypothetical protein